MPSNRDDKTQIVALIMLKVKSNERHRKIMKLVEYLSFSNHKKM